MDAKNLVIYHYVNLCVGISGEWRSKRRVSVADRVSTEELSLSSDFYPALIHYLSVITLHKLAGDDNSCVILVRNLRSG
jgi:hypothetical protein